jgi:YbgC/YbaW family acyl-CoA thioester hydrolase
MPLTTTRTVLFGDCDPGGIIYTPRVAYFVVEAVHDFLAHALGGPAVRELFAMGILPPARSLSIEFLAPFTWDDVLAITVVPTDVGRTSFGFHVSATGNNAQEVFRATLTQVCVSPDTMRPVPVPERLSVVLRAAKAEATGSSPPASAWSAGETSADG